MKAELAASGLSEEDILKKAQMLMKAFGREDSSSMAEFSLASAQKNAALKQNGTSPKDFAQVFIIEPINPFENWKIIKKIGKMTYSHKTIVRFDRLLCFKKQSPHVVQHLKTLPKLS